MFILRTADLSFKLKSVDKGEWGCIQTKTSEENDSYVEKSGFVHSNYPRFSKKDCGKSGMYSEICCIAVETPCIPHNLQGRYLLDIMDLTE